MSRETNGAAERTYRVIGTRPIRPDGVDKVTGKARYGADIRLPGMLYGRVLRSPHPHARILSIDVSKAEAYPGVKAVVTGADMPLADDRVAHMGEENINLRFASNLVMARDRVYFKGQPVAAVAAEDMQTAAEALHLIEVRYEPLPVVEDCVEAMRKEAPLLHDDLYTITPGGEPASEPSNVAQHIQHERGDVAKGFEEADVVIERTFRTQMVHQGYIEPQNATASWEPDGRLSVWTSTQGAFEVRNQLVELLRLDIGKVKVTPMEIGGGFGGKIRVYLEPLAALLSKKSGRPVKMWMGRSEVFQATGPGSPTFIRCKIGAKRTGELTAAELYMVFDAGAFPGSPVGSACVSGLSLYKVPNFRIDGFDVVTNKPRVSAYRAPGAPQAAFAVESVLDEVAEAIGIDPLEFRHLNAVEEGDRMTTGAAFPRIGFKETLKAAMEHPHYKAPSPGPNAGRGVAAGMWGNWHGTSTVHLTLNPDGTVNLVEGSTDIGGSRASMAMIVAEALGLEAHDVNPQIADTDSVGYNDTTGGSRVTYSTGVACHRAALDAIEQLRPRAAQILEIDAPGRISFEAGEFFDTGDPAKRVHIKEVARQLHRTGGPIVARGVSGGLPGAPGFGVHIVDLKVDPETGKVDILRYTAVQDVGTAIHPTYVEGQLQGGVQQGLGWALTEEYVFDRGEMRNPTLLDYRMLTSLDLPMIDTVLVEVPNPGSPYGVRGVGEVPIIPPAPAAANAIYRAIGLRLQELPMTPERIWSALSAASSGGKDQVAAAGEGGG